MSMNAAVAVLEPALQRGLGGQPAVIGTRGMLTYEEIWSAVRRHGDALRRLGVQPGQRVLLLLKDSPALVAAYLGVMAAGAVTVTLNLRSSAEELAYVLRDSGCALALVDPEFLPVWRAATPRGAPCPTYSVGRAAEGVGAWEDVLARASADFTPVLLPETAMAFWIYTSGTTGQLKACVHRQQDVLLADAYLRDTLAVTAGMRLFATSKLFFAYALGTCLLGGFRLGATTILLDQWPTPTNVAEVVARHQPDVVFSVPAFYRTLLNSPESTQPGLRRVRTWVSAGERLPASVFQRWQQAMGREIVEGMGTSESIYMMLTHRPGAARPGTCGAPAPGAEARLLHRDGQSAPAGEPGLLQVRMQSLAAEYWRQPTRSVTAFSAGWFNTGDVFTVDADGFWRHGGRQEDRIPVPGGEVNPADVEEALQELPGIVDACLVAHTDGSAPALTVFAVSAGGADRRQLEMRIREIVTERLKPPAAPCALRWVAELPRTASGKVQRYRLRLT